MQPPRFLRIRLLSAGVTTLHLRFLPQEIKLLFRRWTEEISRTFPYRLSRALETGFLSSTPLIYMCSPYIARNRIVHPPRFFSLQFFQFPLIFKLFLIETDVYKNIGALRFESSHVTPWKSWGKFQPGHPVSSFLLRIRKYISSSRDLLPLGSSPLGRKNSGSLKSWCSLTRSGTLAPRAGIKIMR